MGTEKPPEFLTSGRPFCKNLQVHINMAQLQGATALPPGPVFFDISAYPELVERNRIIDELTVKLGAPLHAEDVFNTLVHVPVKQAAQILEREEAEPCDMRGCRMGIYFLMIQGTVVYVGQSINAEQRVLGHSNKEFDSIGFLPVTARYRLSDVESLFILRLKPHYNATLPPCKILRSRAQILRLCETGGNGEHTPVPIRYFWRFMDSCRIEPAGQFRGVQYFWQCHWDEFIYGASSELPDNFRFLDE